MISLNRTSALPLVKEMLTFNFDRTAHAIQSFNCGGNSLAGPFEAYNNVDSHSKAIRPNGTFD